MPFDPNKPFTKPAFDPNAAFQAAPAEPSNPNQVANNIEQKQAAAQTSPNSLIAGFPELQKQITSPEGVQQMNNAGEQMNTDNGITGSMIAMVPGAVPAAKGLSQLLGKGLGAGVQGVVDSVRIAKSPLDSLERLANFLKGSGSKAAEQALKEAPESVSKVIGSIGVPANQLANKGWTFPVRARGTGVVD